LFVLPIRVFVMACNKINVEFVEFEPMRFEVKY